VRRAPGLVSRDLAAASAFGSVALSGVLPLPVLVVFPIAFVLSLFGVRPLAGRRAASVIVLLIIALALFGAVLLSTLDLVVAAVSFATLVTCHRMLADPSAQASRQVLLSGLLLVSGGAALTGEVAFALFLLSFFVAATWSMAWLVLSTDHQELEAEERRSITRQLLLGCVASLVMGLAFFIVFPRLSWNLATRRAAPGLGGVTGMSDTVRLGGGGDIKTSARVAFRVQLLPDSTADRLDAYFVGRHFDAFDGTEWSSTGVPSVPAGRVALHRAMAGRALLTQDYELTPAYGSRTLVAIDTPTSFGRLRGLSLSGSQPIQLIHVPGDQILAAIESNGLTYAASSDVSAGVDIDAPTSAMSAVPSLDPRILALANELGGSSPGDEAIARTLERQLRSRYGYTLELPGDVNDPLADFLFVRKAGHCEDFATALAVMLRLRGIPSRIATGFFGGERSGLRYVVRAGDAHAWVEAFVDGAWLRLDATPDAGRTRTVSQLAAFVAAAWERLEDWWRLQVLDYSFSDQVQFARTLVRPPNRSANPASEQSADGTGLGTTRRWAPWAAAGVVVVLLVLLLLRRRQRPPTHPAEQFLSEIEGRLRQRQIAQVDSLPLEELTRSLAQQRHPVAPALAAACRRYLAARFGGAPISAEERTRLIAALESPSA
jgi:hypothetical protein